MFYVLSIESKQIEEEIDIDLEDPETEKAALKIQGAFKGLRSKRNAKSAAQPPAEGVCVRLVESMSYFLTQRVRLPFVRLRKKRFFQYPIMHNLEPMPANLWSTIVNQISEKLTNKHTKTKTKQKTKTNKQTHTPTNKQRAKQANTNKKQTSARLIERPLVLTNYTSRKALCVFCRWYILKTCWATRNPEFPGTGPNRNETSPGTGSIFKNIFGSGRRI